MKIATWNVNSLKVRQQHVIDWLVLSQTDVLCLQELKLPDEKFPRAELEAKGYKSWFAGQKTYNGVGILVRDGLAVDEASIVRNIPGFEDEQQRVICATVEGMRVISAYFRTGQAPGTDKFAYKLRWLNALHDWIAGEMAQHSKLALLGDYNIAPEDRDVHDPKAWEGQNLVSPEERAQFERLIALGLVDAFPALRSAGKELHLVGLPHARVPAQRGSAYRSCAAFERACPQLHAVRRGQDAAQMGAAFRPCAGVWRRSADMQAGSR